VPRVPEMCATTTAIMLHIYFDLRTYALGRLVKRLLGARASERQWPHLHRVSFVSRSFTPLTHSLSLSLTAWNIILAVAPLPVVAAHTRTWV
jgi:hypothetical protein